MRNHIGIVVGKFIGAHATIVRVRDLRRASYPRLGSGHARHVHSPLIVTHLGLAPDWDRSSSPMARLRQQRQTLRVALTEVPNHLR